MSEQTIKALVEQLQGGSDEDRFRLLSAINEKEQYFRVLNNFALSLIGITNYDDLVWFVAKEVVGRLGFVDCVIYEYLPEEQALIQRAAMGEKSPEGRQILNVLTIPLGTGVTGRSAKSRKPIIVDDLAEVEDYVEDLSPARSEICVPLLHGEEMLGVIDCEDPNPRHFSDAHLEILTMVASMTSSKIKECRDVKKLSDQAEMIKRVREAVVVTNMQGKIIDCNNGALAMYEYDRDQLVGRSVLDFLEDPDIWQEAHEERAEALSNKGLWRGYDRIRTGTGKVLAVDTSLTPITDEFGNHVATIGVGRDMTALMAAEAALREKNEALERALKEGEIARNESNAKDAFLANTSHELRTPLAGLVGMMDLLTETSLSEEQKEMVSAARISAGALKAIVDDILDLAKMEAGKLALRIGSFDPIELAHIACRTMAPAADAKGLTFIEKLPEKSGRFLDGDENRIRQILFNLIGNAIKFTETGSVSLELALVDEGKYGLLEFRVSDTGIGFSEEEFARIFKRFQQLDQSSKKSAGGAGLGLAISRELAALMGGVIDVNSREGEGSDFRFRVKLKYSDRTVGQAEQQPEVSAPPLPPRDFHVLIVEDNPINQVLVTKYAARAGWRYTVASNGREAVDLLEAGNLFDFILMDIRMPVMDGEEATKIIRSLPSAAADTPIIALTANTMAADKARYLNAGMNAVVGKPIDQAFLLETVRSLMQDSS